MPSEIDEVVRKLTTLNLPDVEHTQVAMRALMNPLILAKVFCSLDVKTLKSARLVCTVWGDVGTTFLGRQGRLTFFSSPKYFLNYRSYTNLNELTSFNHNLAKNVTMIMKCDCPVICQCPLNQVELCCHLPPKFVILLPQIFDKLETLTLYVDRTYQPGWHELWRTHQFPNLTQISIMVPNIDPYHTLEDVAQLDVPQFLSLPSLKVLSVRISAGYKNYFTHAFLSPISQGLLNCAPNLEKLELKANFFPDLTPCRKLGELKFDYQQCEVSRPFDISGITKMLESCRDSLKKLCLDFHGAHYDEEIMFPNFDLPNLTYLKVHPQSYEIEESLNITNLPKLTHFSLFSGANISVMIRKYHFCHAGITSLNLQCSYYPEVDNHYEQDEAKLINLFPAVEELKLNLAIVVDKDYFYYDSGFVAHDADFLLLTETLRSLGGWGLACRADVEIELKWLRERYSYKELDSVGAAILEGLRTWKGLSNTTFKFVYNGVRGSFKLLDGIRAGLLACRSISSVTLVGFQMSEQDSIEFGEFIEEYNLPVRIPQPDFEFSDGILPDSGSNSVSSSRKLSDSDTVASSLMQSESDHIFPTRMLWGSDSDDSNPD